VTDAFLIDDTPPEVVKIMGDALVQHSGFTREQVDALSRGEAAPAPTTPVVSTPEGAKVELERLKRDPEFTRKYVDGNTDARRRMDELHALAAQGAPVANASEFGAAQPHEYTIPPFEPGKPLTPEVVKENALYRGWLAHAGFPAVDGSRLVEQAVLSATTLHDPVTGGRFDDDHPRCVAYAGEQRAFLEKVWKGDTQKNIDLALQFVEEIDRTPEGRGVSDRLWDSGAIYNAWVLKGLYEQAARRARR
jgi:hypothetical protein